MPRFPQGSPGARLRAETKRPVKPIGGLIQTGQYPDRAAIPAVGSEDSGDNRRLRYLLSNNFRLVAADPSLLLDSCEHTGFTLSHPMALPPEPVPVDAALWRAVFPPHLDAAIAKAGRWLFRGRPPETAFARGAEEIAARHAGDGDGVEEEALAAFRAVLPADEPDGAAWYAVELRETVARHAAALAPLLDSLAGEPSEEDVTRIGREILDLSEAREFIGGDIEPVWCRLAFARLAREVATLRALDAENKRNLLAAAAEWKTLPSRYRAEDETPAEDENVYVLGNEKLRIERELSAVWPADAIWPASAWTSEGRAEVEAARGRGDAGAAAEAERQATVKAATDRIVTLSDEIQDYREPEPGESPKAPSRRLRVLLGTLDETGLASPEQIPNAARDVFRVAVRRHRDRLWQEWRQAKAYRQRLEMAETEADAARTAARDGADREAGRAHAAAQRGAA